MDPLIDKMSFIILRQDATPEEAAEYYVQLSNPTGGSRLGNTIESRKAVFYVKDSDDAYGVVEFAGSSYQAIVRVSVETT